MPTFAECLAALPEFRNELHQRRSEERATAVSAFAAHAFATHGAFAAFSTPLSNVHATGVGVKSKNGEYTGEVTLKVYVFDKVAELPENIPLLSEWKGLPIDVEELPVQAIRTPEVDAQAAGGGNAAGAVTAQAVTPEQQRHRPIVGGISISPLNADFIGTLGCFVRRKNLTTDQIFALSNNHVLADVNQLPLGTKIVQPGPELPPFITPPADVFATLSTFIPIHFPTGPNDPTLNRFDAAIAAITPDAQVAPGSMLGLPRNNLPGFDPSSVRSPEPNMRVMKVGRTTGFTRGMITATNVQGTQVNYGSAQLPRIAVFRETIEITGDNGQPFSLPGDSGSIILEEATGHPVALLFAGDGKTTTACDLGTLCQQLNAFPF
jgi:hypothetical protein